MKKMKITLYTVVKNFFHITIGSPFEEADESFVFSPPFPNYCLRSCNGNVIFLGWTVYAFHSCNELTDRSKLRTSGLSPRFFPGEKTTCISKRIFYDTLRSGLNRFHSFSMWPQREISWRKGRRWYPVAIWFNRSFFSIFYNQTIENDSV